MAEKPNSQLNPRTSNMTKAPASGIDSPIRNVARVIQRIRRWSLGFADILAVSVGILAASRLESFHQTSLVWVASAIPVWLLVAKASNLYDRDTRRVRHSTADELSTLLTTSVITIAVVRVVTELTGAGIPAGPMIVMGSCTFVVAAVFRTAVRWSFVKISPPERTILIGSGPRIDVISRRLRVQAGDRLELVGYLAEQPDQGQQEQTELSSLGSLHDLETVLGKLGVSRVVVTDEALDSKVMGHILSSSHSAMVSVTIVPANHELIGPKAELNRVADLPMLDFHLGASPRSTLAIKRCLDVLISMVALALTAPFLILAAVAIKLDTKGPVLFRQIRIGEKGKPFTMFKLRTMVADADKKLDELIDLDALNEPAFKIPNDPRVTRTGRFLRRSSLDEVPQFINVLRGDMSLVGPRPEEEAVVALYNERQRLRLSVKPGLTGPMQVAGRGTLSFEERLALERDYLDNMTVAGDLLILLKTPRAVLKGDGAF